MATLTTMNPNSTLTSSTSTNHLRRTLQALPHLPEDDDKNPLRGKVEHFVPVIWIPDGKTDTCMRCGRPFGWRRRRHHCRLCGRCVCGSCSGKVLPNTLPRSDQLIQLQLIGFLARPFTFPRARRTETATKPLGLVSSVMKPCFPSWMVPPQFPWAVGLRTRSQSSQSGDQCEYRMLGMMHLAPPHPPPSWLLTSDHNASLPTRTENHPSMVWDLVATLHPVCESDHLPGPGATSRSWKTSRRVAHPARDSPPAKSPISSPPAQG